MTREQATVRCEQLNREETGDRQWLVKPAGRDEWEIVSVTAPGFHPRGPLTETAEVRPRPDQTPDPRPTIIRNIPPYGPA